MEADGVADAVGHEGVLAGNVDLDQAAAQLHGQPGCQRLIEGVLLVAEAAADVGLDDADPAPVDAQRLTDGAADDVRDLGGGDHDDLARLLIGVGHMVFNVAVLDGGGVVPLVHADEARFLDGLLIIALADLGVLQDIVGVFLVELGRAVLHGLLHVEDEGQLLIFHLDGTGSLCGSDLIFRHDCRHIVAVIAHMAVEQITVGHILMGGLHRPGMARRGIGDVGNVKAGEDPDHTGDLFRSADVYGFDDAMGDGGADDMGDQRSSVAKVVCVLCSAGSLVEGINTGYTFAYIHIM